MAGRRPRRIGDEHDTLRDILSDAVEAASEAADDAGLVAYHVVPGRSGLGAVFAAAKAAVGGTEPGNVGPGVFDAALRAAEGAVADSSIPVGYDRMRGAIASIPDHLVRVAARHAAGNRLAGMPAKARTGGGGRLLGRMRTAAIRAAKTRLGRDDGMAAVRAATEEARAIAEGTIQMTSEIVVLGAPVHAATAAVFGAAIRGIPPGGLADAVEDTCRDLPEMARRHDDTIVSFVTALSEMIAADAAYRRKYQTAVRGAEDLSKREAADQILNMITGNTFEAVYMVLVAGAYATDDGFAFESGYKEALAAACGVDPGRMAPAAVSGGPSHDIPEGIPEEVVREMTQRLSGALQLVLGSEEDAARQSMFRDALEVDYKAAASGRWMGGIISLYGMAYRAGYEGAGLAAARKSGGSRRRR